MSDGRGSIPNVSPVDVSYTVVLLSREAKIFPEASLENASLRLVNRCAVRQESHIVVGAQVLKHDDDIRLRNAVEDAIRSGYCPEEVCPERHVCFVGVGKWRRDDGVYLQGGCWRKNMHIVGCWYRCAAHAIPLCEVALG